MCVHREEDCQKRRLLSSDTFPPRVAHSWLGRPLWPVPGLCLTSAAQPHSWAQGPSASLISDLLICMLPFGVLGCLPALPAALSFLQGPHAGARPGESASQIPSQQGPRRNLWSWCPLCKSFKV